MSSGLNLKILTCRKLCNFVQLGWKFGGIFIKQFLAFLKTWETTRPYNFCAIQANLEI